MSTIQPSLRLSVDAYRRRVIERARQSMQAAAAAFRAGDLDSAYKHAEQAHVLGQRYLAPHLGAHLWFLRIGVRRRDWREVVGQIRRLLVAPLGNLTGRLPVQHRRRLPASVSCNADRT